VKLTPNPAPFRFSLGERGELAACGFLIKKGYAILEKNYKCRIGEIDLIARRKGRLAFVEVKTRTSGQRGAPQEAVDLKKQEKIFRLAEWYLKEKRLGEIPVAFDVVAVLWQEDRTPEIRLIMDAFEKSDKDC
jgi:putative endonuclease